MNASIVSIDVMVVVVVDISITQPGPKQITKKSVSNNRNINDDEKI